MSQDSGQVADSGVVNELVTDWAEDKEVFQSALGQSHDVDLLIK